MCEAGHVGMQVQLPRADEDGIEDMDTEQQLQQATSSDQVCGPATATVAVNLLCHLHPSLHVCAGLSLPKCKGLLLPMQSMAVDRSSCMHCKAKRCRASDGYCQCMLAYRPSVWRHACC